jgi:hypothetical protein
MVQISPRAKFAGVLLLSAAAVVSSGQNASAQAQFALGEVILGAVAGKLTEYGIDYLANRREGPSSLPQRGEAGPRGYYPPMSNPPSNTGCPNIHYERC